MFVSLSEISALRFITDSKGSGINLIKDAYNLHFDDPEVVESICVLVNEMVQYGEMVVVFVKSLPLPNSQKNVKKTITAAAQGCVSCSQERLPIYLRREDELELRGHPTCSWIIINAPLML